MRYFTLLDFQYVIILIFLGIVVFLLLYIAFGARVPTRDTKEEGGRLECPPDAEACSFEDRKMSDIAAHKRDAAGIN